MALASSGEISIGGSTTGRSINLELGRSANATSSLDETSLRTLAQKSSGTISLSDFWGKANVNLTGVSVGAVGEGTSGTITADINFASDGTWTINGTGYSSISGNWTSTSSGIGSSYWIRFTETAYSGSGATWTVPSGWVQLNTTRSITASRIIAGLHSRTWTIEIAGSSSGSPVVATQNGVVVAVEKL